VGPIERRQNRYVHVPDTAVGGYLNFNRFYFGQVGNKRRLSMSDTTTAARWPTISSMSGSGPLRNCAITRDGEKFCSPLAQIYWSKDDDH